MSGGPIDDPPWPKALTGHVVARGDAPRVHGYDVQGDLASHYRVGETVLLSLTGHPPDGDTGKAFEVAMIFASAVDAGEAPAHAGIVARLCGAPAAGVVAVVAAGLAERSRALVSSHRASATSDGEREAVRRFRACLPPAFAENAVFGDDPSLDACLLTVLHACGISGEDQVVAALTIAGMACACAEAFATKPGDFKAYPMNTPPFVYEP